jgi:DNA-binding NarL/FixJ family response regulator
VIKVLIVSESAIVRAGIRALLKNARDVRVVGEAGSTDEALRLVASQGTDLLLLSPLKRASEGLELLRHVRARFSGVASMLLAREASASDLSQALSAGCSAYITLDVARQELVQIVQRIARGERVVEPKSLDMFLGDLSRQPGSAETVLGAPERQVLRLLAEGRTNRDIGRRLKYSLGTVKHYTQRILRHLEASNRTQAAVKAVRLGLLD